MERTVVRIVRKLLKGMVDLSGIEPLASSSRTRRSPGLPFFGISHLSLV
jgi:hypothetical protein